METKRYFYLKASVAGCGVIAGVNKAPILVDFEGNGRQTLLPVNEFILGGENTFNLDLFKPVGGQVEKGQSSFEGEVFLADPAQRVPTPLATLRKVRFPSEVLPEVFPQVRSFPFEVRDYENPVLAYVEPIEEPTPQDVASVRQLIDTFFEAVQASDFDKIIALNERKFQIRSAVYYMPPERFAAGIPRQFGLLEAATSTLRLVCEDLQMRPIFNGSVFHVDGLRGMGSFRIEREGTDESARFNLYVGKYRGEWTILL